MATTVFKKLEKKKGKVDRSKIERIEKTIEPKTELEQQINDYVQRRRNSIVKELGAEEAFNIYVNLRNMRHDLWVNLLMISSSSRSFKFGDIRVEDFCESNFPDLTVLIPNSIRMLTPDILCYDRNSNFIFLGDVAVTKSVRMTANRKYHKYYDIERFFNSCDIQVKHQDLIINEDLSNCYQQVDSFINNGLIYERRDELIRCIDYTNICNEMMRYSFTQCTDKSIFTNMLSTADRTDVHKPIELGLPSHISAKDVSEIKTQHSEDEIIQWIKEVTDKDYTTYFDSGIDDSISELEKLINKKPEECCTPKSTLQGVFNLYEHVELSGHSLIDDYVKDLLYCTELNLRDFLISIFPTIRQIKDMKEIYVKGTDPKEFRKNNVFGPFQFVRSSRHDNYLIKDLNQKLMLGKHKKNDKKKPKSIDPSLYNECNNDIEKLISYLGSESLKSSPIDNSWDSSTQFEQDNSNGIKEIYDYVKSTCAVQLGESLSGLYQRLIHLRTSLSTKDNIYIPPNGSFIAIIFKNHAPTTSANCDVPMIFITRYSLNNNTGVRDIIFNEAERDFKTQKYKYEISKLFRVSLDKMAAWDQAGYRITANVTHVLNKCRNLIPCKEKVTGILSIFMIDLHQKTSEYLDLNKYIAFMPFSDISCLSKLIKDKMNIMKKTKLDVWLLHNMKDFIIELSNIEKIKASKPKLMLHNFTISTDSLGMRLELPSFCNNKIRHADITEYLEEITMLNIVRPKHLYGSQFLDSAVDNIVVWNEQYKEEISKHGGWAVDGFGSGKFPFDSKFCFSSDAIIYAQRYFEENMPFDSKKVSQKLQQSKVNEYMHYNCSLRGCTKERSDQKNNRDIHTTSLESCLKVYRENKYSPEFCTSTSIALHNLNNNITQLYSMSEKDQRGGGRPIATPTLGAKAELMCIEKPEIAIGKLTPNNIIVEGKNKLNEQCKAYKELLVDGSEHGFKEVYQLTEDQSKFSENDNTRKYYTYIRNNNLLDPEVRKLQLVCMEKLINREHLVKRMPKSVNSDSDKKKYINQSSNGVKAIIGWPQGMLNMISTSVHSIADMWITDAYNKAYPDNKVITKGLVHSDDSIVTVACNSKLDFRRFAIFRAHSKKLFCLKINEKKLWGSKYLGEVVSNYNINGNVHLSISKIVANCMNGLLYQNWGIDTHTQISSIQQAYRSGADIPTLIMLKTVLRQQLIRSYNVKGLQKELLNLVPIELGGFPNNSVFELGVTGVNCYYKSLLEHYAKNPNSREALITLKALRMSMYYVHSEIKGDIELGKSIKDSKYARQFIAKGRDDIDSFLDKMDFEAIAFPTRGEVFTCIKHIMPKSKKITKTLNAIKSLPFNSDGLEMVCPRPKELGVALGHLKQQTSTILYNLASEKYSQSAKRLAACQAIQATGKVMKVGSMMPMTCNQVLYYFSEKCDVLPATIEQLITAFEDDTGVSVLCKSCVFSSTLVNTDSDKRKVINKLPEIDTKFKTISMLPTVLMYIIDESEGSRLRFTYTNMSDSIDILKQDASIILKRFSSYFQFFGVKKASNIIVQQYYTQMKAKLWTQPKLRNNNLVTFFQDLYGKTVSGTNNYEVTIDTDLLNKNSNESNDVETLYSVTLLNKIYNEKFVMQSYNGKSIPIALNNLDYANFSHDIYLKYGILQNIYNGSNYYLRDYDEKKEYNQEYLIPQRKDSKGKFHGYFECLVSMGKTVCLIRGSPEDVKIESNSNNIKDVLLLMQIFINKNFRYYSYQHPTMWYNCTFWQTKTYYTTSYLTNYSGVQNLITKTKRESSIAFILTRNLKSPDKGLPYPIDSYIVDETYKVVYKKSEDSQIKVGSVTQSLYAPNISKVRLIPDTLDGLANDLLLETKAIINITLHKHHNTTMSNYKKILESKIPSWNSKGLMHFWANIMSKFVKIEVENQAEQEYLDHCTVHTFEIKSGENLRDIEEICTNTKPEDLSYIETSSVYEENDRIGAIFKHTNVLKVICNILSKQFDNNDVDALIWIILKDKQILSELKNSKRNEDGVHVQTYQDSIDLAQTYHTSIELCALIIGHNLTDPSSWISFDLKKILKKRFMNCKNPKITLLAREAIENILDLWFDKVNESSDDILDLLL